MADGGWDVGQTIFIDGDGVQQTPTSQINKREVEDAFHHFLRTFQDDGSDNPYKNELRKRYKNNQFYLEVNLSHLRIANEALYELVYSSPAEYLPILEDAVTRLADELTSPREDDSPITRAQVMFTDTPNPLPLRELGVAHVSRLVQVPGIVIKASTVRVKATQLRIQCRGCMSVKDIVLKPGLAGTSLPRQCDRDPGMAADTERCPLDPYEVLGEKSLYINQQVLKLQEQADMVPQGELPRYVQVCVDRYLTRRVAPGSRVVVLGVYDIMQAAAKKGESERAVRVPYLRAMGLMVEENGDGRAMTTITPADEERFKAMAESPDIHTQIATSICPQIYGSDDIKKAVACLLFGGSRKVMRDGMRLRGDVNVLLLGDPGTAKSQLLKSVEKLAPVAVYTSGKGSSAAGLTASVVRDPSSRDFYLEAGALVLADGGVACIDEFDKMREEDRVAIHEAMEQQTISIAKAGITTVLNSRCSVLAAANSTFGRWDDMQAVENNIDMQATILSRFDMIFVVRDAFSEVQDSRIGRHVVAYHQNAQSAQPSDAIYAPIDEDTLRKYINYARRTCGPRLSPVAARKLRDEFVKIRANSRGHSRTIPITVRQLEAIVRISESLAKMRLDKFATENDVEEALRLFQVSTLQAAATSDGRSIDGQDGDYTPDIIIELERMIKRRMPIGAKVSERDIVMDLCNRLDYNEAAVKKALAIMTRRGELQYNMQGKYVVRVQP